MAKRHTAAAAACLLLAGCLVWAGRKRTVTYLPDESAFPNAQIGYAPGVLDSGTEGATLRYLGLTWRQLEPEEGAYAWETIEQTCHLAELRARGVHLVLRISCDEPGDEAHLDIPDWLYEQTGTGRWYDIAYGKGYAPDYTDPVFLPPTSGCCGRWGSGWEPMASSAMWSWGASATGASGTSSPERGFPPCPMRLSGTAMRRFTGRHSRRLRC